jgi:hypothetical protein
MKTALLILFLFIFASCQKCMECKIVTDETIIYTEICNGEAPETGWTEIDGTMYNVKQVQCQR